ncbi:uncharacterized protein CELE_C36B1.11 [Caenorhabditis elegans]|uniref:Uncharacterized protein n=1 Tax=Caenorhabditis elegans TaxID=6239 RepID=Q93345_CAEEL|nr:Uncharacterized protein CELE_C36B1.11 [Caenorhabditis elegans]CAB02276.1 Uncharacterized protein CELE_C36B1.11 [Caenorhabditis elegans]|eukprot:NP_492369.1 Uncharacterized protein CELE_C36B1.11 [Caenorhabditis elegans]
MSGQKCSAYTDTMGTCTICSIFAPHSQLFICRHEGCKYALKQSSSIMTPAMFYRKEKVICGKCAFVGPHKMHKDFVSKAQKLAFKIASQEIGVRLQMEFDVLSELHEDNPVDYAIILSGHEKLEKIDVIKYLSQSKTIVEWNLRQRQLNEAIQFIKFNRIEGYHRVKELANKMLDAFYDANATIERDSENGSPQSDDDHLSDVSHECQGSSRSSISSKKSSIHSTSTTGTVILNQNPDNALSCSEVSGGDELKNKSSTNEGYTESMTETVITISRRFEMCIRRESPEDAVSRIADYLDDRIESNDQKKAIAEYMERNYSIKWPRQFQ